MKPFTITAVLLLSACAAPDWCYEHYAEIQACLELQRQGERVECACQTATSGSVTTLAPDKPDRPKPEPVDPGDDDDDDDDGEEPDDDHDDDHSGDDEDHDRGHGNDEDGHDEDNPGKSDGIRVVVYDKWPSRGRW